MKKEEWTHVTTSWDLSNGSKACVTDGGIITIYDKEGKIKEVLTGVQWKERWMLQNL